MMNWSELFTLVADLGGESCMSDPKVGQEFSRRYLHALKQCTENGVLQHINRKRNINPVDIQLEPRTGGMRKRGTP